VAGFCLLIFYESSRPIPDVIPPFFGIDKLLHFGAWMVLGFLFYRAFHHASRLPAASRALWWVSLLSAAAYGLSDEIHQSFVPFRTADFFDFVADFAGSLCGTIFISWWYTLLFQKNSRSVTR